MYLLKSKAWYTTVVRNLQTKYIKETINSKAYNGY